jgi:glutamyl-tRNA synthetase
LHVLLYRCLGWSEVMPQFAHLPLLLKPDGKGKLSKRDGDKLGFPVFPMHWEDPATKEISSGYDDYGFTPEAFINFLSLLGWNPGTTQEIFTIEELSNAFSLEKVSKSGAKFDFEKAKWFNQHYIKATADGELAKQFNVVLTEKGISANIDYVTKVCGLVKERVVFLKDFWQQSSFFFVAPESYDAEVIKKRWKDNIPELMAELSKHLDETKDFSALALKDTLHHFIESKQANMGAVMNCLRLSMVGGSFGPDLPVILEMLGKDEVVRRIDRAVKGIAV